MNKASRAKLDKTNIETWKECEIFAMYLLAKVVNDTLMVEAKKRILMNFLFHVFKATMVTVLTVKLLNSLYVIPVES